MIKQFLLLLVLFICLHCIGETKEPHPIYNAILKLKPRINKEFAMDLSNHIHKYSNYYGTDPLRTVAIIMQESSFTNVITHSKQKRLVEVDNKLIYVDTIEDMGYYQFSYRSILDWKLDPNRIISDIEYATKEHCRLLKKKMISCKRLYPDTAWACWHSATKEYHDKYVKMVNRFYKRIK